MHENGDVKTGNTLFYCMQSLVPLWLKQKLAIFGKYTSENLNSLLNPFKKE